MVCNADANSACEPIAVPTILLVEDFDQLRNLSVRLLTDSGYRVIEARNGVEALACFESHQADIHLLVTDLRMPEMNGLDLVAQIRQRRSRLPVLLLSGYATESVEQEARSLSACRLLQKPCLPAELLAAVHAALTDSF